jgi:ATP-binding cassette subfamily F protein 3
MYIETLEELCAYTSHYHFVQVSHDEHLISGSVDELWVVSGGKATPFLGSFAEYKKTLRAS